MECLDLMRIQFVSGNCVEMAHIYQAWHEALPLILMLDHLGERFAKFCFSR